jgi:hypothetical protein
MTKEEMLTKIDAFIEHEVKDYDGDFKLECKASKYRSMVAYMLEYKREVFESFIDEVYQSTLKK